MRIVYMNSAVVLRIALCLLASALVASAQSGQANITGTVVDSSQALVVGARVNAVHVATGTRRIATTNEQGVFTLAYLDPGIYEIQVEKAGFRTTTRTGIKLDVAQIARLDFVLDVGVVNEHVEVTAQGPLLDSVSATLSQTVENQLIINLPTNGRNSYGFASLVPGVRASRGFNKVADGYNDQFLSINGSRPNLNNFQMDGGANSSAAFNGPAVSPSLDAVEEYKVQTNNFSAEFSNSAGGVINLITKSGTNKLHGTLFEFLRNEKLTANDFFSNRGGLARSPFRFNQFGGTVGGPVTLPHVYQGKDRTFFFFSYEGLRWVRGVTAAGTMPTDLERAGDFSNTRDQKGNLVLVFDPATTIPAPNKSGQYLRTPFPGNVVPASHIDPIARAMLKYFAEPRLPGNQFTNTNNYISNYSAPVSKEAFSGRVDHSFTDNQRLFVRFTAGNSLTSRPALYGPDLKVASPTLGNDLTHQRAAVVNYTSVLGQHLVMELSSSFLRQFILRDIASYGFDPVQLGFPNYFHNLQPAMVPMFPVLSVTGLGVSVNPPDIGGGLISAGGSPPRDSYETFYQYGNLTNTRGTHTLKAGGNFGTNRINSGKYITATHSYSFTPNFTQGPNPLVASSTSGDAFASFLLGLGSGTIRSDGPGENLLYRYFGVYFQDDWKVTRNLTLNLGIRYDYDSPWTERFNRVTSLDYTTASPLQVPGMNLIGGLSYPGTGTLSRGQWEADRRDFSPRIGFAYVLGAKTVLRGGYGVFFGGTNGSGFNGGVPMSGFDASTTWVSSLDGVTPANYWSNPYPTGFQRATGSSLGLLTQLGQSVTGMDRGRSTPYAEQWNLDVQRVLPGRFVFDVAYAGSRGVHLPGSINYDQLPNALLSMGDNLRTLVPNPFYGLIQTGTLAAKTVQQSQLLRPYPQFTGFTAGNIDYGASTYHALQAKLERRFSSGFSLLAAYTFSKLLDDVGPSPTGFAGETFGSDAIQDFNNRRNERSVASFDTPHVLTVNWVYELPFGAHKAHLSGTPVLRAVLGGWQINGITTLRSGTPLGLAVASNTLYNYGGTQRPNWTGKDPTITGDVNHYFDVSAFTQPAPYSFGNTTRMLSYLRAPGAKDIDLSVFRNFRLHERASVQFRAETFNLFNHPEFGAPGNIIGSSSAGVISVQANSPRDIQFGLKLIY